jgi:hypothetical protein
LLTEVLIVIVKASPFCIVVAVEVESYREDDIAITVLEDSTIWVSHFFVEDYIAMRDTLTDAPSVCVFLVAEWTW